MKIVIGGKEVKLVDRDVKTAKKLCRRFLRTAKTKAEDAHAPTFYEDRCTRSAGGIY